MTAIFGLWHAAGDVDPADFARMDRVLARYGGDGHGTVPCGSLMLGRHLHATVPEDAFDRGPVDGVRYVVCADARLTERDALAAMLALGPAAATMSDAALVAAAIEAWHEAAFDKIYGAFAIAAWDKLERRLLLARDHLGQKPLFFHRGAGRFAFASMPVGLHALPEIPHAADPIEIVRFLRYLPPSRGRSFYVGIDRVGPGHYAVIDRAGVRAVRYWRPDLTPVRLADHEAYVAEFALRLDSAVAAALRGVEGMVGAELSAGFDSTAVATTAARQLATRGGRVVAFTSAPRHGYHAPASSYRLNDESGVAAATAAMHPNIEHVVLRSDRTPLAGLDRNAASYGGPLLNLCNQAWLDAIRDAARDRGITVMLDGVRGNATISETGTMALHELFGARRLGAWSRIARGLVRDRRMRWRGVLWHSLSPWLPFALWRRVQRAMGREPVVMARSSALKADRWHAAAIAPDEPGAPDDAGAPDAAGAAHPLDGPGDRQEIERSGASSLDNRLAMIAADDGAYAKGVLAEWAIDMRDPTADRRLVEFSLRMPVEQLIHGGEPRAILRRVLRDRAPPDVLDNRRKGYQAADWHEGVSAAHAGIADEVARIERFAPSDDILDVARLKRIVADFPAAGDARWETGEIELDCRYALLRAVSAASFMRRAAGSNQ